jgi:hypothetical protein
MGDLQHGVDCAQGHRLVVRFVRRNTPFYDERATDLPEWLE